MHTPADKPGSGDVRQLYLTLCGRCHAADGSGGTGPDLRVKIFRLAPDLGTLMQIIVEGIPAAGMPQSQGLSIPEVAELARYVRGLADLKLGQAPTPGNPVWGERLLGQKGNCARCHMIRGKGGRLGPDLTGIGSERTPAQLRASLLEPAKSIPTGYQLITLTTSDGHKISGVLVGEDTFTIRIRDAEGRLHGLDKSQLSKREPWNSPMPSFRGAFTDSELDDVVAYLASLTGQP